MRNGKDKLAQQHVVLGEGGLELEEGFHGLEVLARRDMVVEVPQAQAQAQAQAEVGQALEEAFQEGEHEEYDESSKSSKLITATFLHDGITAVPTRIKRYPSHI